ncbi:hypothetical protein JD969_11110 [Planctomycetota bacterium]|nr:hypothetical protein JD969_11110 [Planctomycetota bacterium]
MFSFIYCRYLGVLICTCLMMSFGGLVKAESEYIYGMHDPGGERLMGKHKGWIVHTEGIGIKGRGGKNFSKWSRAGYTNIVRLNYGYYAKGTLPFEKDYDAFAKRCAAYVKASKGVEYWIIGNETNLAREWPGNTTGDQTTGQPITAERYIKAYLKCYEAIKKVAPKAKVCPSPVGTWAPPFPNKGIDEFDEYWVKTLEGIGAAKIDGLILHAYTHGADPKLVRSERKMGPPYEDINYHFRVYRNLMSVIPSDMRDKPVMITECDQNIESADNSKPRNAWVNKNTGWMKEIYEEINDWNLNNDQKIRCVAMFRWPAEKEGEYTYGIEKMRHLQKDFKEAARKGYKWTVKTKQKKK